jgi:hypothetical protein
MASPFRAFRKHQKQWLAILGVMTILSFVFLPIVLDQLSGRRIREVAAATSTKYGKIYEGQLSHLREQRQTLFRFVSEVIQALAVEGAERTPQARMDQMRLQRMDDDAIIDNWLMTQRAREVGMTYSDKAVKQYLQQLVRGVKSAPAAKDSKDWQSRYQMVDLKPEKYRQIMASLRIGPAYFLELWREQLMAWAVEESFADSVVLETAYGLLPMGLTPGESWDYFQRLNRAATVELLPIAVSKLTESIANPDDATLDAFFAKYKNTLPVPNSPEPGFRQPHRVALQYLKAEHDKFTDPTAVTENEIRLYYEDHKDVEFREFPELPVPTPTGQGMPRQEAGNAGKGPTALPSRAKVPPTGPKPAEKPPAPPKPGVSPPSGGMPPAGVKSETKAGAGPSQAAPTAPAPEKPVTAAPQSGKPAPVAPQTAKPAPTIPPPAKPAPTPGTKDSKKTSGNWSGMSSLHFAAADGASLVAQKGKPVAAAKPSPAAPVPKAGEKRPETAASVPAKPPSGVAVASPAAKSDQKPAKPPAAPPPPAPPKYRPLKEVEGIIRDKVAQRKANQKIQEVLSRIQSQLDDYYQQWQAHEATKTMPEGEAIPAPPAPDFQQLAKENKLSDHQTLPVTDWELARYDIGSSSVLTGARGYAARPRSKMVDYTFQTLAERKPTLSEDDAGNGYLFWKTADEKENTPSLSDAGEKDHVRAVWKEVQARAKAEAEANKLADEAGKSQKSLTELFGTRPGRQVIKAGPFTWMTFGSLPARFAYGGSRPQISEVRGVTAAGNQFMQKVFQLAPGRVGVAANQPQTDYYVIRVTAFSPSLDQLWDSFRDHSQMMAINTLAVADRQNIQKKWMADLRESAGFKWVREPSRIRTEE